MSAPSPSRRSSRPARVPPGSTSPPARWCRDRPAAAGDGTGRRWRGGTVAWSLRLRRAARPTTAHASAFAPGTPDFARSGGSPAPVEEVDDGGDVGGRDTGLLRRSWSRTVAPGVTVAAVARLQPLAGWPSPAAPALRTAVAGRRDAAPRATRSAPGRARARARRPWPAGRPPPSPAGAPQLAQHRRRDPLGAAGPLRNARRAGRRAARAPAPSSPRRRAPRRAAAPGAARPPAPGPPRPAMPCAAAYGRATWPCTDATTTSTPDPCAIMCGSAARAPCTAPSMSASSPRRPRPAAAPGHRRGPAHRRTAPTRRSARGARRPRRAASCAHRRVRGALAVAPRAPDAPRAPSARPTVAWPTAPRGPRHDDDAAGQPQPAAVARHQPGPVQHRAGEFGPRRRREVRAESSSRTASSERVL